MVKKERVKKEEIDRLQLLKNREKEVEIKEGIRI
jgi:hypothetical protein